MPHSSQSSSSGIDAAHSNSADVALLASRRAVQDYRQRLLLAAMRRWSPDAAGISRTDVLNWLSTSSTLACCAPLGLQVVVADPLPNAASHSDAEGVDLPPRRVTSAPPPPPLPKAPWCVVGPPGHSPSAVHIAVDTADLVAAAAAAAAVPTPAPAPAVLPASALSLDHAEAALLPPSPTAVTGKTNAALEKRVHDLTTRNADLDRRCERLRAELASLRQRQASPSPSGLQRAPSGALVAGTPTSSLPGSPAALGEGVNASSSHRIGGASSAPTAAATIGAALPGAATPPASMRTITPPRSRTLAVAGVGTMRTRAGNAASGNAKARVLQQLRELRSKLAVIRTGVKALGASDLFHNAASLLQPFLAQHTANARRMAERADFFEKTAQGMQAKLLSLPDGDSPEGYEVQLSADGRSSALYLDAKTWVDFTHAFTSTIDQKFVKVENFANRGARSLMRSANHEKEMKRSVADLEMRCGELESVAVDWECLAIAIAADSIFESVTVQPCKKLEFAALQKQLSDSNDEVRVVCGVSGWFAKTTTRTKATVWRDKRADAITKVEQLLSQELQHFMMNGPQRNSLRRKVLLLRELASLLQRLRTDNDPLPAAAAIVASNAALPSGLALAAAAPVASSSSAGGTPVPPAAQPAAASGTTRASAAQQQGAGRARDLSLGGRNGTVHAVAESPVDNRSASSSTTRLHGAGTGGRGSRASRGPSLSGATMTTPPTLPVVRDGSASTAAASQSVRTTSPPPLESPGGGVALPLVGTPMSAAAARAAAFSTPQRSTPVNGGREA